MNGATRTIFSAAVAIVVSVMILHSERNVPADIPLPKETTSLTQSDLVSAGTYNNPVARANSQRSIVSSPIPAAMKEEPAEQNYSVPENQPTNLEYPVSRTVTVMATGYSSDPGAVTFTGTTPHWGEVAVDPRFISLETTMIIPEFPGTVFRAEDTGGLVKGFHVDIWFPSRSEALEWGVKYIRIYLLHKL